MKLALLLGTVGALVVPALAQADSDYVGICNRSQWVCNQDRRNAPNQTKVFTHKHTVCVGKGGCHTARNARRYSTQGDVQWTMSRLRNDRDKVYDYYAVALTYRARLYRSCSNLPEHYKCLDSDLFTARTLPLSLARHFSRVSGRRLRLLDYAPKDVIDGHDCQEANFDLNLSAGPVGVSAPIHYRTCDKITRTSPVQNPFDQFAVAWNGGYSSGERTVSLAVAFKHRHSLGRKTFQVRLHNPFGRRFVFNIGLGSAH